MTFIGSILWIGVFSYLMVWWAHQVSLLHTVNTGVSNKWCSFSVDHVFGLVLGVFTDTTV